MTPLKECCWMHFNHLKISVTLFKVLKVAMPYITVIPRAHLAPQGIVMFRSVIDSSAAQTEAVQRKAVTANR